MSARRWKRPEEMSEAELHYALGRGQCRAFYDSLRGHLASPLMTVSAWALVVSAAWFVFALIVAWSRP